MEKKYILIISISVAAILVLIILLLYLKFFGINKIHYNRKSNHLGVLKSKKIIHQKGSVIELSTKPSSKGKENILMVENINPSSNEPAYIIPKVKNRKLSDLELQRNYQLNKKDKITTDKIFKKHKHNVRKLKKEKRQATKKKNKRKKRS